MQYKVLALDLDGTLTNNAKVITPRTKAALQAAADRGVRIVLASGRPTVGIEPLAKELELDRRGGCILSYNGGKIIDCKTGETLVQTVSGMLAQPGKLAEMGRNARSLSVDDSLDRIADALLKLVKTP